MNPASRETHNKQTRIQRQSSVKKKKGENIKQCKYFESDGKKVRI